MNNQSLNFSLTNLEFLVHLMQSLQVLLLLEQGRILVFQIQTFRCQILNHFFGTQSSVDLKRDHIFELREQTASKTLKGQPNMRICYKRTFL